MTDPTSEGVDPSSVPLIVSQANKVGQILHTYVTIHEDIFAGGLIRTLRRLLPFPGLFEAIDFDKHWRDLESIVRELDEISGEIGSANAPPQLSVPLRRYSEALFAAVSQLGYITRRLADKRDDPSSYTKRQYKTDLDEYEKAVAEYRSKGEQVNRAFRTIQGSWHTWGNHQRNA